MYFLIKAKNRLLVPPWGRLTLLLRRAVSTIACVLAIIVPTKVWNILGAFGSQTFATKLQKGGAVQFETVVHIARKHPAETFARNRRHHHPNPH
jgi:hypothetical protein